MYLVQGIIGLTTADKMSTSGVVKIINIVISIISFIISLVMVILTSLNIVYTPYDISYFYHGVKVINLFCAK